MKERTLVDKKTNCWQWLGSRTNFGHGRKRFNGQVHHTHRLAMANYNNDFDLYNSKLEVHHKCHNPPCWNPDHLIVGSRMDNVQAMMKAGRQFNAPKPNVPSRLIKGNTLEDVISRVEKKSIRDLKTGCLVWQSAAKKVNTPTMGYKHTTHTIPRLLTKIVDPSFDLNNPFVQALHTCDNSLCLNIEHIYVGTRGDNMRDRWRRKPETFKNLLKKVRSKEFKRARARHFRDFWKDPQFRKKQNEAREETIQKPSYRRQLSKGVRRFNENNPEVVVRRGKIRSEYIKNHPEIIKKLIERNKDPEFRKKVSEGCKRYIRNNPEVKERLKKNLFQYRN